MNIRKNYTILLAASLFAAACSTDLDDSPAFSPSDRIEIVASIASTRVQMDQQGRGDFTPGDRILLFATADTPTGRVARTLTLADNRWTPSLQWSELHVSSTVLSSFYPAHVVDDASAEFVHTVAADQKAAEDFQNSDLLYATRKVTENEPSAHLAFSHLMSRVVVHLSSDGSFSQEELSRARISAKAIRQTWVDCMTGTTTLPAGSAAEPVVLHHAQGAVYMAVVCPQPVADDWRTDHWLRIEIGGKSFLYQAPETLGDRSAFTELQPGKQVTLNITLKRKEEDTDWRNKTVWTYGINHPSVDQWGYTMTNPYEERGLKWDTSYGWYDCNKRYPNGGAGNNDSNLCWAASCSNMLYWWLDQNKHYIDRYGKYAGPTEYVNSLDCEIFELYKKNFPNTGNDVSAALSWFLTGKYGMTEKEGAGFFREVFGPIHVARITRFSERSFPDELKKAFSEKSVLECTIKYPNQQLVHAISLWGADFDASGDVSAIYITENNDRDLAEQNEYEDYKGRKITQAGMIRKRVQKKADGSYYMESSIPGNFTFRIEELNILGLMEDKWEAYFAR
ncbi:IdeS/Mac family cysteine endopeptidase [Alistipes sp.]|uniref:fimbrillin family protein n=1 Tax=Alistipes sp. TaxID=1872444 RepID=UPI0025C054F4|nr:IdeS/Mac family cysteine endopeptidase [Alistipes sp.]